MLSLMVPIALHALASGVKSSPTLGSATAGFRGVVTPTSSLASAAAADYRGVIQQTGLHTVVRCQELDRWRQYEILRGGLDSETYKGFFASRPQLVAKRLVEVGRTLYAAKQDWDSSAVEGLRQGEKSADFDPTKDVRGEAPGEGRGARLCAAMSSLGPVSVKISQTLSQRPDLVGDEAATALKRLQTRNSAYPNELAWAVIREERCWRGPIAPGVGARDDDLPNAPPLFASITPEPVAVASLGQVYKATTHDGREVAVKVQRPDAMAVLATDYLCFLVTWSAIELAWKLRGGFDNGDIASVVDRVAADILDELDYEKEAANAAAFEESLSFLGFVGVPLVVPEYSTKKVLVTEWVKGQHLDKLPESEGLKMTRMAVEACTASLVLTGFVHADPHEGNLMLADDGRIIFLDFGLMSSVSPTIMEAFARGIQACLAEDYVTLAKAFKETGFVNDPVQYRPNGEGNEWKVFGIDEKTGEDLGLSRFASELQTAMQETVGGTSRFGALATVLNQKLAPRWKMFTPPYVLLLIRTFLTLEGIAARVDPDFNIYEMAMPWAVRRSLSPGSADGIATLRATLLTDGNRIQWDRLLELVSESQKGKASDSGKPSRQMSADESAIASAKASSNEAAKASAMNDAVGSLLGSPSGGALRRALRDLDSTDLLQRLVSADARGLRHAAALAVCGAITSPWMSRLAKVVPPPPTLADDALVVTSALQGSSKVLTTAPSSDAARPISDAARPISDAARRLRERQARWKRKVARMLLMTHLSRQLQRGQHGAKALAALAWLLVRVVAGAVRQATLKMARTALRRQPGLQAVTGATTAVKEGTTPATA